MHNQKPIKGGRRALSSTTLKEIRKEIEHLARRYDCSMSFVVSTILADALGIKQERYYEVNKHSKIRRAS